MKILKILLIIILVIIVVGGAALFIFLKTFNIDKYKPQILAAAKESLHRDIDFKDMDLNVSLRDGVNINLKQLAIQEDASFGEGAFLTVDGVSLGVDIMSFLTKREVQVSKVTVLSPKMTVIRNSAQQLNVQTIGKPASASASTSQSVPAATPTETAKTPASSASELPPVFVDAVVIENGTFTFIDQSTIPEKKITLSKFMFKVDHFSFNEAFHFTSEGSVLSADKNFKITGKAQIDPSTNDVALQNVIFSTDFSKLSLKDLNQSLGLAANVPLPSRLNGIFETNIKDLKAGAQGISSMALDLSLNNGAVTIENVSPGVSLDISQILVKLTDFSLTDYFNFAVSAAVLSDQTNLNTNGRLKFDPSTQAGSLIDTTIFSDLSYLSFEKLKASVASLKNAELPDALQGKLNLEIREMSADASGLKALAAEGELAQGSATLKALAVPVGLQSKFSVTEKDFNARDFTLSLGRGTIAGTAAVSDYLGLQNFSSQIKVNKVNLAEVVNQANQPVKIEGLLDGNYTFTGQGFTPESLQKSLNGEGGIELVNGRLKDINILNLIFSKMTMFPNIVADIQAALPPRYKDKLTQPDTILNKVNVQTKIVNGAAVLDPVEVDADGFLLNATGQFSLDQKFSVQGSFIIPEDLTSSMIAGVEDLQYLVNENKEIQIPGGVTGQLPGKFEPWIDYKYIGSRALKNKGQEEIHKVLDKVLGREENQGQGTTDPNTPPQPRPEDQMIDSILNTIFK